MRERVFGKTGRKISEIGLGTWQLGTRWGNPFDHDEAMRILELLTTAESPSLTLLTSTTVARARVRSVTTSALIRIASTSPQSAAEDSIPISMRATLHRPSEALSRTA